MSKLKSLLTVVVALVLLVTINASAQQGAGEPPLVGIGQLQRAVAVQKEYTASLIDHPSVIGTGVSVDATGQQVLKVFTSSTVTRGLPRRLGGVPVVVEYTGSFVALQGRGNGNGNGNGGGGGGGGGEPFDTTGRHRPAPLGSSTGHPLITAGTIGARVKDGAGNLYALSNNHVYANQDDTTNVRANVGDNVLQPGTYDGGVDPADAVGTLYDWVEFGPGLFDVNYVDAAIALTSAGEVDNATPPDGYGTPKSQTATAKIGMRVQKYGRTTHNTTARVTALNVFTIVEYRPDWFLWFDGQIQVDGVGFSAGGDSGSLIVGVKGSDARKPVGLLFAGSPTSTLANPIDLVLNAFGVSIDGS